MLKLTKDQIAKKTKLLTRMEAAKNDLQASFDEANAFVEETRDTMQSFFDEKSENWQEGDKGQQYQDWINSWESIIIEDIDGIEEFENLPDSPE